MISDFSIKMIHRYKKIMLTTKKSDKRTLRQTIVGRRVLVVRGEC